MKIDCPPRPACLACLRRPAYDDDHWTPDALFAMNAAFVAAMRAAHPDQETWFK